MSAMDKQTSIFTVYPQIYTTVNQSEVSTNDTNMTEHMYSNLNPGFAGHTINQSISFAKIFSYYIIPVLVVVGTIGNGLILLTVRQRNFSNWSISFYISAYAVVNIFILVPMCGAEWICKVAELKYIMEWSNLTCKLWQFLMCVIIYSGIWFVFAMLVDQYIIIWLPQQAQSMCTLFMAKFATIIIIIGLVVVSIHAIWTYELFPNGCYLAHTPNDLLTVVWPWVSLSCYCIIPLCLIIIFIGIVVYGVFTQNTWKETSSNYQVPIDITCMTIGLSTIFVIFVTPATIIMIIRINMPTAWLHNLDFYRNFQVASVVGDLFTYLNPTLSIFECLVFSSTFRTELKDTVKKMVCKNVTRIYEMQVNSRDGAGNEFENCSETTPL